MRRIPRQLAPDTYLGDARSAVRGAFAKIGVGAWLRDSLFTYPRLFPSQVRYNSQAVIV